MQLLVDELVRVTALGALKDGFSALDFFFFDLTCEIILSLTVPWHLETSFLIYLKWKQGKLFIFCVQPL